MLKSYSQSDKLSDGMKQSFCSTKSRDLTILYNIRTMLKSYSQSDKLSDGLKQSFCSTKSRDLFLCRLAAHEEPNFCVSCDPVEPVPQSQEWCSTRCLHTLIGSLSWRKIRGNSSSTSSGELLRWTSRPSSVPSLRGYTKILWAMHQAKLHSSHPRWPPLTCGLGLGVSVCSSLTLTTWCGCGKMCDEWCGCGCGCGCGEMSARFNFAAAL